MEAKNISNREFVVDNLMSIYPLLARDLSKTIRAKTSFSPGLVFTLGALMHHKKLTMTGIGCHLSVPKPHVTALVDKLIKDELVERLLDPNDRRIIYIQLTNKGIEMVKEIRFLISQELKEKLSLLSPEQLETLSVASQQVKDILLSLKDLQVSSETSSCIK